MCWRRVIEVGGQIVDGLVSQVGEVILAEHHVRSELKFEDVEGIAYCYGSLVGYLISWTGSYRKVFIRKTEYRFVTYCPYFTLFHCPEVAMLEPGVNQNKRSPTVQTVLTRETRSCLQLDRRREKGYNTLSTKSGLAPIHKPIDRKSPPAHIKGKCACLPEPQGAPSSNQTKVLSIHPPAVAALRVVGSPTTPKARFRSDHTLDTVMYCTRAAFAYPRLFISIHCRPISVLFVHFLKAESNAGISVCASQKEKTSLGPVMRS